LIGIGNRDGNPRLPAYVTSPTEDWTLPDYGFDHSNLLLRKYVCIRRPTRYLYNERGSKPGKIDEIIMKILNDWAKETLPIALNGFKFRAALSCLYQKRNAPNLVDAGTRSTVCLGVGMASGGKNKEEEKGLLHRLRLDQQVSNGRFKVEEEDFGGLPEGFRSVSLFPSVPDLPDVGVFVCCPRVSIVPGCLLSPIEIERESADEREAAEHKKKTKSRR
jgi:hypothetical protein